MLSGCIILNTFVGKIPSSLKVILGWTDIRTGRGQLYKPKIKNSYSK
jgi:hypothetical protein